MNVAIFIEKHGSAIWRLAEAVKRNSPHINIEVFAVHPKRNDVDTLMEAQRLLQWADVIDVHYWKSGEILKTSFGGDFEKKPKMLFHFNPYDLDKQNWNKTYDLTVVGNESMYSVIPYSNLIGYGVNLKKFKYNEDYTEEKIVHMSVNRIEGKKGVFEVVQACKDLGYKMILVGRVSDPEYMRRVMDIGADIRFIENASEEELAQSYYKAAVHVCNSTSNFESGTLPVLEAMACGVPVLTRNIGHIPDLYNGENLLIRSGEQEDIEDLKKNLKELMENRDWRLKLREKAWETVKTRDERRMVRKITNFYYKLWKGAKPFVSVIVPTKNRPESLIECIAAIHKQDYGKIEIIVADSGDQSLEGVIKDLAKRTEMPIKYIRFNSPVYSLAEARNRAAIEAQGEFLVFCDDRLRMEPEAITEFVSVQTVNKLWQWGIKDKFEKGFVENFSCVRRDMFIQHGMFCERIDHYGGMTQEVRTRFENLNAFTFEINKKAHANSIKRATSKSRRREDIVESKFTLFKMYG